MDESRNYQESERGRNVGTPAPVSLFCLKCRT